MSSSTRHLITDWKTWVVYSISIHRDDRNFSPPPNLLFIPSNFLCSESLELRTNGSKERERETYNGVVLNRDIKSN